MFLKTITFRKKKITSNASRRINYFFFKFKLNFNLFPNHVVHFRVFQPTQAGRGALGKNIIRSKGSQLRKIGTFAINFNLRYLRLGFIAAFRLLPFKNKLLSLVFFSNGATTFFLTAHNHNLFKFWFHNNVKKIKKLKIFKKLPLFRILNRIKKLSFVSCLELLPGKNAQYVRSTGTRARLIKFDKISHTVLLQLPSKIKKIFSYYSYALYDQLALADYKWLKNTKSGYWRVFGKKSIVRGVAMNPVDHPHGGRTKTVKTPLTPWGKITKFK